MRVFIYEYFSAGGPGSAAIRAEGRAMLSAVAEDLGRAPGVEAVTLPAVTSDAEESAFRELARGASWSLVIAPECDGLLAERCRWVEEEGGRLLGPSAAAHRARARSAAWAERARRAGTAR